MEVLLASGSSLNKLILDASMQLKIITADDTLLNTVPVDCVPKLESLSICGTNVIHMDLRSNLKLQTIGYGFR